jgi:CBS domain-containing protein
MIIFPELNKFLVKEESSIHDAIKVIDLNGKGVCLVIKKNKQLLGILTDGDIRRILLKNGKISDKIKSKVNKKFFFIKKKDLFKASLENIKKKFFHIT